MATSSVGFFAQTSYHKRRVAAFIFRGRYGEFGGNIYVKAHFAGGLWGKVIF
jgi:hypothetical protein